MRLPFNMSYTRRFADFHEQRTLSLAGFLALRHQHGEALAGPASLQEFRHLERMTGVAALLQLPNEFRGALREDDVAIEHDGVAAEDARFFLRDIDQVRQPIADRA